MNENPDQIRERLQQVKYVGPSVAEQLYEELSIRTLDDLAEAAEGGWLREVDGIGESREQDILASTKNILDAQGNEESETGDDRDDEETSEGEVGVKHMRRETTTDEIDDEQPDDDAPEESGDAEAEDEGVESLGAAGSTPETETRRPKPRIDRFVDRLRCPACGHDTFDRTQTTLTCTACRREYSIHAGVADLAPADLKTGGLAQRVMESRLYSRFYESYMRPTLTSLVSGRTMEDEKELSAEMLELDDESVVLDVACGTGNFTRHFAEQIAASTSGYEESSLVVGMDISWPMLERAQEYLRRDGLNDRVFLIRGDATRIPVGREMFNRLHCAGALHLMDDIDEALRNFARVLQPDSLCVIGTFLKRGGQLERMVKRVSEIPSQFHWFEREELHDRLERTGFEVVDESRSQDAVTVKARRH